MLTFPYSVLAVKRMPCTDFTTQPHYQIANHSDCDTLKNKNWKKHALKTTFRQSFIK